MLVSLEEELYNDLNSKLRSRVLSSASSSLRIQLINSIVNEFTLTNSDVEEFLDSLGITDDCMDIINEREFSKRLLDFINLKGAQPIDSELPF